MSPIFVRPVREQLEHDRLVRFLQAKYIRKFEVALNAGDEQVAPVKIGSHLFFPDLVLSDGKKPVGVVEVESAESVNNLEALAEWVHFARARVPFHLYVPVQAYDGARRLCEAHRIHVTEVWTYRPLIEGFDLVRMLESTTSSSSSRSSKGQTRHRPAAPASKLRQAAPKAKRPAPRPSTPARKKIAPAARKPAAPIRRKTKSPTKKAKKR